MPEAADRLEAMVNAVTELGPMVTFRDACQEEPVGEPFFVEDGMAWHRTYAEVWAGTPEAKRFDPQLDLIRNDYRENVQAVAEGDARYKPLVERFWFHLTNAANSDGRWPPPRKTSPYHREWVEKEIARAREALDALKRAVRAEGAAPVPLPIASGLAAEPRADGSPVPDLTRLNWKELQDELYKAHELKDRPETCVEGARRIRAIFTEYARRGVKRVAPPVIREP